VTRAALEDFGCAELGDLNVLPGGGRAQGTGAQARERQNARKAGGAALWTATGHAVPAELRAGHVERAG
jgi:hypothetical protein